MNHRLPGVSELRRNLAIPSLLLVRVRRVTSPFGRAEMLRGRNSEIDPAGAPLEVGDVCSWQFRHLREDLDARRSVADDRYAFVRVVVVVVPGGGMDDLAFEIVEARDGRPLPCAAGHYQLLIV